MLFEVSQLKHPAYASALERGPAPCQADRGEEFTLATYYFTLQEVFAPEFVFLSNHLLCLCSDVPISLTDVTRTRMPSIIQTIKILHKLTQGIP